MLATFQIISKRILMFASAVLVGCLVWSDVSQANQPKVGDTVEFEFMGQAQQGTIVSFTGLGKPMVKFTYRGRERTRPIRPEDLRSTDKSSTQGPNPKIRTWTSSNGKYKIKARLESVEDDKVVLVKEDGKKNSVEIAKLSPADQGYIEAMRDAFSTSAGDGDNPFESGSEGGTRGLRDRMTGRPGLSDEAEDPSAPEAGLADAVMRGVKPIILTQKSNWKLNPDVSVVTPIADPEPIVIEPSSSEKPFFDKFAFAMSSDGTGLAMSISNAFEDATEVRVFDMTTSDQVGTIALSDKHLGVRSVGSHGRQVVTSNDTFYDVDHIAIWSAEDGSMSKSNGWRAPQGSRSSGVGLAELLNEGRLLAGGRDGLVIWDIQKHKALHSCAKIATKPLAFSGSRKQVVFVHNKVIYLVDTEKAKQIASIGLTDEMYPKALAFNDDGTRLAGLFDNLLRVWDLTSGEQLKEIWLLQAVSDSTLEWADERFLLAGGNLLVDAELGITAWNFKKSHDVKAIFKGATGQFWYAHYDEGTGALIPFELPQSTVKEACEEIDPGDLEYLEPGPITVKTGNLSVSGNVRGELNNRLREFGYTPQDNAPIVLTMYTESEKSKTEGVRNFFDGPFAKSNQTITYTPKSAHMKLERNGIVLWEKSGYYTVPPTIHLNENESAQQAANRYCQVPASFFTHARIPLKGAILPGGKLSLGESTMGPNGIQ